MSAPVTHEDLYYRLGEIEAKLDRALSYEPRLLSLERFRAWATGLGTAVASVLSYLAYNKHWSV